MHMKGYYADIYIIYWWLLVLCIYPTSSNTLSLPKILKTCHRALNNENIGVRIPGLDYLSSIILIS
jgi:hypothetical protein